MTDGSYLYYNQKLYELDFPIPEDVKQISRLHLTFNNDKIVDRVLLYCNIYPITVLSLDSTVKCIWRGNEERSSRVKIWTNNWHLRKTFIVIPWLQKRRPSVKSIKNLSPGNMCSFALLCISGLFKKTHVRHGSLTADRAWSRRASNTCPDFSRSLMKSWSTPSTTPYD